MTREQDLERIIIATHALARVAALETKNETPAAQWRTLSILTEHGRAMRLGELATLSRVTQPGMTRLVGTMAEAGLVVREADDTDSRVTLVEITDAGREAFTAWRTQIGMTLLPRFADLDEDDWDALRRAAGILARKTGAFAEVAR